MYLTLLKLYSPHIHSTDDECFYLIKFLKNYYYNIIDAQFLNSVMQVILQCKTDQVWIRNKLNRQVIGFVIG